MLDALWVLDQPTEQLKATLDSLLQEGTAHARLLVKAVQEELAERECHDALTLLLQQELLLDAHQEQQHEQAQPAKPYAAATSPITRAICCIPQHQQLELQQHVKQQEHLQQHHQLPEHAQQCTSRAQEGPHQEAAHATQQLQQQQHTSSSPKQQLPGASAACQPACLTPLQAAQRAFLEERQRIHKARVALQKPANAPVKAAVKQQSCSPARCQLHSDPQPKQQQQQQHAGSLQQQLLHQQWRKQQCKPQDKWHSQQHQECMQQQQQQQQHMSASPPRSAANESSEGLVHSTAAGSDSPTQLGRDQHNEPEASGPMPGEASSGAAPSPCCSPPAAVHSVTCGGSAAAMIVTANPNMVDSAAAAAAETAAMLGTAEQQAANSAGAGAGATAASAPLPAHCGHSLLIGIPEAEQQQQQQQGLPNSVRSPGAAGVDTTVSGCSHRQEQDGQQQQQLLPACAAKASAAAAAAAAAGQAEAGAGSLIEAEAEQCGAIVGQASRCGTYTTACHAGYGSVIILERGELQRQQHQLKEAMDLQGEQQKPRHHPQPHPDTAAAPAAAPEQQAAQAGDAHAGDAKPTQAVAAAAAALAFAVSARPEAAPGSSLTDTAELAEAPEAVHHAVYDRVTGRAGHRYYLCTVHQPLQLDSWRDWDVMAGSLEEGSDGFGAWGGVHD